MTLEDLDRPGPARSAAVGAIAGRLTMGGGCCRDRAHAIAPLLLDDAITAARDCGARMDAAADAIASLGRRQEEERHGHR